MNYRLRGNPGNPLARLAISILALTLSAQFVSAQTSDTDRCAAAKMKSAGKYAACRLAADGKAQASGDPADYSKCDEKLASAWLKIEGKYGSECPSSVDRALVQDDLTSLAACLQLELNAVASTCDVAILAEDLLTCSGGYQNCTSTLATCTGGTATVAEVRSGRTFSSSAGNGVTGTADEGTNVAGEDGSSSVVLPDGFYAGGKTATAEDADLLATNIRSGVTIFGVTGTYERLCGNGTFDAGEECELGSFNGETCVSKGYSGGTLACYPDCTLDERQCYTRVFVTSDDNFNPDLGGLAGGDAKCQAFADAAALGNTWTAWLSSSTVDARDRIPDNQYRLVDGTTLIANNLADLLDGSINASINLSELGTVPTGPLLIMTGTRNDGTRANTCNDWTSDAFEDFLTPGSKSTTNWSDNGFANARCATAARLFCFEQRH